MAYYISSGMILNGTTLSNNSMYIYVGGVANSTTANSWGDIYVSSGGTANSTTVNPGGVMHISSGGVANSTTVNSYGDMSISSGGEANSTTVNYCGSMYIESGGTATEIVENGGYVQVEDGANVTFASNTISGLTISGKMTVHSNTVASSTTVNSGGRMYISSGGTALEIKENGGYVEVADGANVTFASNTIILLTLQGDMTIHANTVAHSTTVDYYGTMSISSGGTANNTTVNSGGRMYISSGGIALKIKENGGYVEVADGANVTFVANTISALGIRDSLTVHSATVAEGNAIYSGGRIDVFSGGKAYGNVLMGSRNWARLFIHDGGVASGNTVLSGGIYVSRGGVAENDVVSAGFFSLFNKGVGKNTKMFGGLLTVFSGGTATDVTVTSGASLHISSGGSAINVNWTPGIGDIQVDNGAYVTYASEYLGVYWGNIHQVSISDQTVSYGRMYVMSYGIANNITVEENGNIYICNGGTANSTTFSGGDASMYISSGGTANDTTLSGGVLYIFSGGVANKTTVDYATMYIFSGGVTNRTTVNSGGNMHISSGGTATNVIWTPCVGHIEVEAGAYVTYESSYNGVYFGHGGQLLSHTASMSEKTVTYHDYNYDEMYVMAEGVATSTTVNDGSMYIHNGGVATSTLVNNHGHIKIYSGGNACNLTVERGGSLHIASGASATDLTWTPCNGKVFVEDGAYVTYTSSYSGVYLGSGDELCFHSSGISNKSIGRTYYYVYDGAELYVMRDGTANDIFVESNGVMYVSNGGAVKNTEIGALGDIYIFNGGIASESIINEYGSMFIFSGGIAEDSIVPCFGTVIISSGGIHKGSLQIEDNATFVARSGSIIDFTVASRIASDDYLINDLSLISGTPTYTVTVAENQEYGTYKLAKGAENFTGSITIGDGTINYGSATANEQSVWYNGITYSIKQENGYLTLEIYDITPPEIPTVTLNTYALTNSDLTVTAAFSDDSVVKQYRIGNGEWQNYIEAFTVSENGTIYFRAEDAAGNESTNELVITHIDKVSPTIPVGFNETISNYNAKLDWSDASDAGVAGVKGYYVRYGTSETLTGEGKFIIASEFDLTNLAVGTYYYQVKTLDNADNISEWSEIQSFEVKTTQVQNLRGDSSGLSWDAIPGVEGYIVEYSTDNFANVMSFETTSNKVDSIALPVGTYQWRVKAINGENFSTGENIISQHIVAEPQEFVSNADGNTDVFFANANGKWGSGYAAQHTGILYGWSGTSEQVTLAGKNKLADIFEGSSDANILLLTDDANGDALFVDDIYTALPGTVAEQQARIAKIDEIRAGNGDDIVDMTSQRLAYIGDGVKIYGGIGNDTIWANNGSNSLFGDAGNDRIVGGANNDVIVGGIGNDRMHGGGGDDIFTFGNNWGNDTIEQLANGAVTLWFETGAESCWNASELTYSDGVNSVKVSGVTAENITLKFGGQISGLPAGCFDDAASEKIFEDKNKGFPA